MSLASDVVEQLRAVLTTIGHAKTRTTAIREQAVETQLELQTATDGSSAEKPAEARVRLEQAQVKLDEAVAEFDAGAAAVEEYIAAIGGARKVEGPPTGRQPPTAQQPASPRSQPTPGPHPTWRPDRPSDTHVAAIKRLGWPRNPSTGALRARGQLYHRDGTPWNADVLIAHHRGPARERTDLKEPWASDPDYTVGWHIEGNTAALMVRHGEREAVLYINEAVCGAEEPQDPKRCHSNIAAVLPVGYTLYVHSVQESGWHRRRIYKGTGEAIR